MTPSACSPRRALAYSLARLTSAAAVCAVLSGFSATTEAANFNWDPAGNQSNSGGAGIWDLTSLFWNDDNVAPNVVWPNAATDNIAIFGGTGGIVTIDTGIAGAGVSANGLTFNADGYTIISDETTEVITLVGTNPTMNVSVGTATISVPLAGTAGLTKTGAGILDLAAQSFGLFGPITVNAGAINFQDDLAFGDSTNGITLNGGRINHNGPSWDPAATRVITIGPGGGTIGGSGVIRITDVGQIAGSGTLIREATGNNFALDLQQANVGFTGNTILNSGTIEFRDNAALGNTAGQTVTINNTGRLAISTGPNTGSFAPTLSLPVTLNGGALSFGNQIGGTVASNINVTADSSIFVSDFYQIANRGGAITGVLSGNSKLTVAGVTGTLVGGTPNVGSLLLRNGANTFSGTFSIGAAGQVRSIQSGGNNPLSTSTIELNGGGLGLASTATAAGANSGFFGRYYNSTKIGTGVAGGFDWKLEPQVLTRNDETIDYFSSVPAAGGVNGTNMGVLWTGILKITDPGTYAFSFRSDDGSMIYVDGQMVVANDFSQGPAERFGSMNLTPGFHSIIIKYAQGTGGAAAQAFYNGPDTAGVKSLLGGVAGSITNNGGALFAPTTMSNNINVVAPSDIDLAGADGTSTGAITFSAGTSLRVTGVTGFETLTQSGPVTLNGNNTITTGIVLTGNLTNTHNHNSSSADMVVSGNIGQAVAGSGITKMGPRSLTLSGVNTFTGPIVISEGRLIGNSLSLPTAITNNAALGFNQTVDGTYGNVISGPGTVDKSGAGTLSFTGANTYTGATTVFGGAITGTGSLVSTVSVFKGGGITGTAGSTFTVGGLVLNPQSNAAFTIGAPSLTPLINSTGTVLSRLANVNLTNAGGLAVGTYRLIDYGGLALTPAQFAGFGTVTGPGGFVYGLTNNTVDGAIDLTVETLGTQNTWTGTTSGVWDTTTANWNGGNFASGQRVTFPSGVTNRAITGSSVSPQAITVSSGVGEDYSIANPIVGTLAGGLAKTGGSTLHLTGANTFAGPIAVSGGTLRASVSAASSGLGSGAVTLADGTTLQLDPTGSSGVNGVSTRYFTTALNAAATGATVTDAIDFTVSNSFGVPVFFQTETNLDPTAYTDTNPPAGGVVGFDEGTANANWKSFAIERTGRLNITTAGWYSFFTGSDDGTKIFINGKLVANNDGGHGVVDGAGTIFLAQGLHDFRYEFAQGGGGADERIQWAGPGFSRATLPSTAIFTAETASVAGASNEVNIGTPLTTSGTSTVSLNGSQFAGVRLGALIINGGTLKVTGDSGKSLSSASTRINGSITIENSPRLSLGRVDDLGTPVTITKAGNGTLTLDHTGSGFDASQLSAGTVFDVQAGVLQAVGSTQPGASNPLGSASIRLNGGSFAYDTKGGTVVWQNPVEMVKSGRLIFNGIGIQTIVDSSINIPAGLTLTIDASGGARNASSGYGTQVSTTVPVFRGTISGPGNLVLDSTQTNGGQAPAAGSVQFGGNLTYTGLTQMKGFVQSQSIVELRDKATFKNTSGFNAAGKIVLTNNRLNLQNNGGANLDDRIPDAWPIEMSSGTIRFDGANGTPSNETVGAITLVGGQNNLFGGTVTGSAFHTLTAASMTRQNRSTLRLDANALGSLSSANGIRFVFTDSTGFNKIGGDGSSGTNTSIIPWVWGAPTGNNRSLVTYDFNGLRTLEDFEYSTLSSSLNTADNIRESVANNSIGTGAAQTINSLVLVNLQTADQTLTLTTGTVLNVTSGAVLLGTTDGTARRVTLNGGTLDFGNAEGVLIASRREHLIQSQIRGTNGLTISGDGQITLNQTTNDFTGLITVTGNDSPATDSAQLNVNNDASLGNLDNDILLDGGGLRFNAAFTVNANRTFTLTAGGATLDTGGGSGTIAGQVTGPGDLFKVAGNTLTLPNTANNYTGETYFLNGNMVTNTGPQGNIHNYSAAGTLTFDQAINGTYPGNIDGTGSVAKSGLGTVTFTGTHTYVGTTVINAGTLIVNGSIGGSTTTVNSGTLGGTGSIAFNIVVGNNGGTGDAILSPGVNGIGTLTAGRNVTFNPDAAFKLEINTTTGTTDLLQATGTVALGLNVVPLNLSDLGSATLTNFEVFTFLTATGGITGQFAGLPDGAPILIGNTQFNIDYTTNAVRLIAIPEPSAIATVLGGLGVLAGFHRARRRR